MLRCIELRRSFVHPCSVQLPLFHEPAFRQSFTSVAFEKPSNSRVATAFIDAADVSGG